MGGKRGDTDRGVLGMRDIPKPGCCCPGCVCAWSRGIVVMLRWDAGEAPGSPRRAPASCSPPGCSGDTKRHGPVDSVSLIDHGKRQRLVTCRERSGRVTADFVVRAAPARTGFAPLSVPAMEGRFLLISLNASSKQGEKRSLLCACLPVPRPGGVGSAPQRCQHPRGAAAGLTAPASFIARCWEQNYFYHLLSLLSASPPARGDGRGFNQSFSLHPGMCFESFCPVLPLSWLPGDVSGLGSSRRASSLIDPSRPCLGLAVLVIYQAGLEMGMWCLSPSLASLGRLHGIHGGAYSPPSSKTTHIPKHLAARGGGSPLPG